MTVKYKGAPKLGMDEKSSIDGLPGKFSFKVFVCFF
jgi:hypothetical protein